MHIGRQIITSVTTGNIEHSGKRALLGCLTDANADLQLSASLVNPQPVGLHRRDSVDALPELVCETGRVR